MGWIQNLWIFHMNLGMNIQRASVQHPFGSLKHQGSVAGLLIHNTPAVFVQKWGIPQCMPILIEKLRFQTPSDLDSAPKFETQPMSDLKDRFSHDITPPATTHYLSFIFIHDIHGARHGLPEQNCLSGGCSGLRLWFDMISCRVVLPLCQHRVVRDDPFAYSFGTLLARSGAE